MYSRSRILYYSRYCYFIYWYHRDTNILLHWTPLLHVLVSSLHGHFSTLDTVFDVDTCYTEYYYFMYSYQHCTKLYYTERYYFIYLYHCYTDTIISYSYITLHGFTCIHTLIVLVFLLYRSLFLLHVLLLFKYSYITLIWIFLNTVHACFLYHIHDCFPYSWHWYDTPVS